MSTEGQPVCGPVCSIMHNLINKLSVIVGSCQLLGERTADPESAARLQVIRQTAEAMADEIGSSRCQVVGLTRLREAACSGPALLGAYSSGTDVVSTPQRRDVPGGQTPAREQPRAGD
jgi:hypothetical protein